ncbi:hypothetical protein [Streptomyces mirabilis]|uniref:hypothetical protein n=1 Tax=Streptomyces mirabilis TaxID=68239 RepID=UPI003F4D521A
MASRSGAYAARPRQSIDAIVRVLACQVVGAQTLQRLAGEPGVDPSLVVMLSPLRVASSPGENATTPDAPVRAGSRARRPGHPYVARVPR